jgi:hypothetical protein
MSYEILIQQGFWMHLSKEAISNPLCFTTSPEEPNRLNSIIGMLYPVMQPRAMELSAFKLCKQIFNLGYQCKLGQSGMERIHEPGIRGQRRD